MATGELYNEKRAQNSQSRTLWVRLVIVRRMKFNGECLKKLPLTGSGVRLMT